MKRNGYLVALLLVAIVITGCTVTVSNYGSVAGYVYIPQGSAMEAGAIEMEPLFSDLAQAPYGYEPAEGVTIVVGSRTTVTRRDGFFGLANVPARSYTLVASGGPLRFPIKTQITVQVGLVTGFGKEYGTSPLYGGIGYYVVIGIDDYLYESGILPGPRDDAIDVFNTLVAGNKLAGMGKLLIRNGGPGTQPPTKSYVQSAIREAVQRGSSPDDYLVIYFSGISGQDYLRASDDKTGDKWITDAELESWVSPFPGHVTLIVDGTYSETMADGIPLEPLALRKTRYTVLAGAGKDDLAWHDEELGKNSVFTHFLLEGIRTRAADSEPAYGDITARELWLYTDKEMYQYDSSQLPYFHEGVYGDTVIFRY